MGTATIAFCGMSNLASSDVSLFATSFLIAAKVSRSACSDGSGISPLGIPPSWSPGPRAQSCGVELGGSALPLRGQDAVMMSFTGKGVWGGIPKHRLTIVKDGSLTPSPGIMGSLIPSPGFLFLLTIISGASAAWRGADARGSGVGAVENALLRNAFAWEQVRPVGVLAKQAGE